MGGSREGSDLATFRGDLIGVWLAKRPSDLPRAVGVAGKAEIRRVLECLGAVVDLLARGGTLGEKPYAEAFWVGVASGEENVCRCDRLGLSGACR
jgi:hypothetical protein